MTLPNGFEVFGFLFRIRPVGSASRAARHRPLATDRTAWPWRAVRTRRALVVAGALVLGLTARGAAALKDDDQQPMLIEADTVEVDESKGTSLYVGHVQVDQGSMRLLADQVTVHHRKDRRIRYIIARGAPAAFKQQLDGNQGEMQAFAKRMDYDADRDELVLTEEALVIQGMDRITGDRIVYDRAQSRMQAGGTGRVKITIVPDAKGETKGGGKPKVPGTTNTPGKP